MDESLNIAARTGDISDMYTLIRSNGNVLRCFDEVEFIDTPLHVAAEGGHIEFAMEMMNLKPSFSRKLNQQGFSPLHLAVENGHKEMALRFLEVNKDLVRVKGKNGITPLHLITEIGNQDAELLDRFLEVCPECTRDVTIENRTALHMAVKNNRLDVLQVLIRTIRKKDYWLEVVNRMDKDGNTALHLAASNNQPQMVRLLLNCRADKYSTNRAGLTALSVAQEQNYRECTTILRGCFIPGVSNFKLKLEKQIVKYVTNASLIIFHDMDKISSDDRNALLVILSLLLTATFEASLNPPRKSTLNDSNFIFFYAPTYFLFIVALFLTLGLLKPYPSGLRTALQVLLAFLAMCFHKSISSIAPCDRSCAIINIFSITLYILMVFMCIAYQVSKLSVSIMGCWIFPSLPLSVLVGEIGAGAILGFLLFLFLHDQFVKGTVLAAGYSLVLKISGLFYAGGLFNYINGGEFETLNKEYPFAFLGCWLYLNLCKFCIKWCIGYWNTLN